VQQTDHITSDATFLADLAAARQELASAQADKQRAQDLMSRRVVEVKFALLDNLGKSEDVRNIQFAYAIQSDSVCAMHSLNLEEAAERVRDAEVALEILKDARRQRELVARERLAVAASGTDAFSLPHLMQRAEA